MKFLFQKATWLTILDASVYIVLGVISIIFSATLINFLTLILGIGAIVIGVIRIVYTFISPNNQPLLFTGILYLAVGLILASFPSTSQSIIASIIGIGILLAGASKTFSARAFKSIDKNWWINFAIGISQMIFGIVLISNPFESMQVIVILIGAYLIYFGVSALLDAFIFHRKAKNIDSTFEQYEKHSNGTIGEEPIDVEIIEKDKKD